jgi:LPS-assembly lipoprotein
VLPAPLRRAVSDERPRLRDQLSVVDVEQIFAPKGSDEARIAVEIRNALLYDFTGGGYAAPPTHRLKISISSTRASIIVDVNTSRPDVENYGINATYTLTEIVTGKVVVTGQTFARVSYDIPSQEQRSHACADCAMLSCALPR